MDRLMKRYGGRQIQWLRRDGWGHHPEHDDGRRPPNAIHLDALFKNECGEQGMDAQGNLIPAEVAAARFAEKVAARRLEANQVETLNPGASATSTAENECGEQGTDAQGNLIPAEVAATRFAAKRARAKQIVQNLNPAAASASVAAVAGTKAAAEEEEGGEDDEGEERKEEEEGGEDDEEEERKEEEEGDLKSKQGPALKRPRKDLVETDSSVTVSSSSSPKN